MKVLCQWSRDAAADWDQYDSKVWGGLNFRPTPVGDEVLDSQPGWITALNIMGVVWSGYDHYAVEPQGDNSVRIYAWIDDLIDLEHEKYDCYARVMTLWPLASDPAMGGAINTRGSEIVYCQPKMRKLLDGIGPVQNKEHRPWDEFVAPSLDMTGHGIWLPDSLADQHFSTQSLHGWKEWSEGVDSHRLDSNGNVASQRSLGFYNKPVGTKTFLHEGIDAASGVHTAGFERRMSIGVSPSGSDLENLDGGTDELTQLYTSESGEPNEGTWPTGDYRCQLDAITIGADITFGLRAAGGSTGHFARVDSGLTTDVDTNAQTEALFGGLTGLKLATTGSVTWGGSTTSDRFECLVAAIRAASHGPQSLGIATDGDGFADGPWTAAAGRIMSSLASAGGLAAEGGIAGPGGGLAG